jgi:hypothetical protein
MFIMTKRKSLAMNSTIRVHIMPQTAGNTTLEKAYCISVYHEQAQVACNEQHRTGASMAQTAGNTTLEKVPPGAHEM